MTSLLAAAFMALATLVQLAIIASGATAGDLRGLPVLPLATLAAWAAAREPNEAWAALLPAPLLLGLASDERVGWFLLAFASTPLLAAALRRHGAAQPRAAALGAVVASGAVAFVGVLVYTLLLSVPAGETRSLLDDPGALGGGALLTGFLAAVLAAALLVLHPRRRGLFG